MGVPFEALLPYAIMLGVGPDPDVKGVRVLIPVDVRLHRRGSFEDQTHAEWREEGKAFD